MPSPDRKEPTALALVREESVYVHPGYFFDMTRGAHLVLSLLTPERDFAAGLRRIIGFIR